MRHGTVSLIARQGGPELDEVRTDAGARFAIAERGHRSPQALLQGARDDEALLVWLLRFLGTVTMFVGLLLFAQFFRALAGVIPLARAIFDMMATLVLLPVALVLSGTTILLAWLAARPLVALAVVLAVGALCFAVPALLRRLRRPGTAAQPS